MSFYNRKIQYYKSFKLIDTDGDGVNDTMAYSPISEYYYLQFGLDQDVRDIGHYTKGVELKKPFLEIIPSIGLWSKKSFNDNTNKSPFSTPIESGTTIPFCNDPEANNYNSSLFGLDGYLPCTENECCTYNQTKNYTKTKSNTIEEDLNCLAFYTDWGPWNNELIYNDTKQSFIKKTDCIFSLRLINQLSIENEFVKGGWYGSSILIEVDSGLGYTILEPGNPIIYNIDNGIVFNQESKTFTLDDKIRVWKANSNTNPNKYYTTKPYRDITFKADNNSKIRVTYFNSNIDITSYQKYAKYLRLQTIKGSVPSTIPTPPTLTTILSGFTWAQNLENINNFLGTPINRQNENETFHFINDGEIETKHITWNNYLNGYKNPTTKVYWGPSSSEIEVGTFYSNPGVGVLSDFGDSITKNILYGINNSDLNYFSNPEELLEEYIFTCETKENYISFFDRNGDGIVESGKNGSVDDGLFSKTRYDSPYIFIKPGTTDGVELLIDNPLTITSEQEKDFPYSPSSVGGWKNYAYVTTNLSKQLSNNTGKYSFKNVSPTCQMGGINNLKTFDGNLVDSSNVNIFLQQPIFNDISQKADFGTGTTVPHLWNSDFIKYKGGCCSKSYDSSLDISKNGPYYNSECFNCHTQMTSRSAQPILENSVRISMQTTDSDVYYGPFYDPQNPTYNGYGLAFSKANKFCREVKNKNGVEVINSETGVNGDELYLGGILHGGGVQYTPNTSLENNYGVIKSVQLGFEEITSVNSNSNCVNGTKIPLKCSKVFNDPNCPKNNCMKCIFCFKCNSEDKQPGIFTGNNSDLKGPTDGINYLG
jgi:hypothetical protein